MGLTFPSNEVLLVLHKCIPISVGSNRKIPNLEPPEPLVNRTSNLPNLFLDFKTEP